MDSEDNLGSSPSASKTTTNVARIQRNVAEKQRRDKLNGYISELASIVPMVSMSSKRLDKTSILRLSAAHLRISKSALCGKAKLKRSIKWCPNFLSNDQARHILESVDGFLILTTSSGKILFTSHSVEKYLGHQDIDLIGHSLYTFIHPEDVESVRDELDRLLEDSLENGNAKHRCSFRCRIRERAQPRSDIVTYQFVHVTGTMSVCEDETSSKSVVNHMFQGFVKIVEANPYNELSLEEAIADEYVTRHSLDGTIIFADHRLATITGHLPHEVCGLNAYEYIHNDDASIALFAQHLMFSSDKGTGMIVYRLRRRDDKYCYLKSVGCLQFDKVTNQVDHFVCVNQYLSDIDGNKQLKYFVDRYIPHIQGNSTAALFESVKALQTSSAKGTKKEVAKKDTTVAKRQPSKTVAKFGSPNGGAVSLKADVAVETAPPSTIMSNGYPVSSSLEFLEDYDSGSNVLLLEESSQSTSFDNTMLFSMYDGGSLDNNDMTSLDLGKVLASDDAILTSLLPQQEDSSSLTFGSDSANYSSPSNPDLMLQAEDELFPLSTHARFQ